MTRTLALAAAGALALALLTGCTPQPPAEITSTPTPTSATPAAPSPTPEPTPSASPATDVTCQNVLTDAEYASLDEDNLKFRPEAPPLGPAMVALLEAGALGCNWAAPQSDVAVWFARLPETDAEWDARRAELLTSGWTESDEPLPGTLTAPADYDGNYTPSMAHVAGVTYFVSYSPFFSSVAELGSPAALG